LLFATTYPARVEAIVLYEAFVGYGGVPDHTFVFTSKEGEAAEAEWAKVVKCKSGLYPGKLVRQPPPAALAR
jgi:hypothetical protein